MSPTVDRLGVPSSRFAVKRSLSNPVKGAKLQKRHTSVNVKNEVNQVASTGRMRNKMSSLGGTLTTGRSLTDGHQHVSVQFFSKEPCLYNHNVYVHAAKIFLALKHDSREEREAAILKGRPRQATSMKDRVQDLPQLVFQDDMEKRHSFELAFKALKCK